MQTADKRTEQQNRMLSECKRERERRKQCEYGRNPSQGKRGNTVNTTNDVSNVNNALNSLAVKRSKARKSSKKLEKF